MNLIFLKIIGVIAAIIALISLIPIGADIGYEGGALHVSAKIAGVLLPLFPKPPADETKPKKPKKKKEKKPTEAPTEPQPPKTKKKPKLDLTKDDLLVLVKKVLKGFGILGRKFQVDRFLLDVVVAGKDPYVTAQTFGYLNAALNVLAPICARRFTVKDLYVRTDVDFTTETPKIDGGIALTIRIGAIFRMIFTIVFGALGILLRKKLVQAKMKRLAKKAAIPMESAEKEIEQPNEMQQDERMNDHGE